MVFMRTTHLGLALGTWILVSLPAAGQTPDSTGVMAPVAPGQASEAPIGAPPPAPLPNSPVAPTVAAVNPVPPTGGGGSDGYAVAESQQYQPAPTIEEPPLPPEPSKPTSKSPAFSVRVDPLNWILAGRLGTELEVAVLDALTVEAVPVFVTSEQPPFLNLRSFANPLHQKSNGLGPISGASIGVGYWLDGKAFRGYGLRAIFTNYAYKYETRDGEGAIDSPVTHTERRLGGMIGSHSRWGAFTLATGFGLGVELNRHRRCEDTTTGTMVTEGCQDEQLAIRIDRNDPDAQLDLFGPLHPAYFFFRISLGLVF